MTQKQYEIHLTNGEVIYSGKLAGYDAVINSDTLNLAILRGDVVLQFYDVIITQELYSWHRVIKAEEVAE